MKPAKRTNSTSSPYQRPSKTRQSCNNCGISKLKCGRQHPKCLPCLERGLACSYSPSRGPATHCAAYSERDVPRSTTIADASFNPFPPCLPSRVDPRSSPVMSSRHHVNRTHFGLQVMGLSPTEHVRPSPAAASTKHIDSFGKTKSSAQSLQDLTQYVTGAGHSNFRNVTVLDAHARENNKPVFDVMAEKKLFSGSAADVGVQDDGSSGHVLPTTAGFEDDLNGEWVTPTLTPCVPL